MFKLLPWILPFLTASIFAETTTSTSSTSAIQSESSTNQILLNNAAESQKIKTTKVGTLKMTNSRGEEAKVYDLTDQEKQLSENFVHQGKANRIIDESCNKDAETQAICAGRSGKHKFMGMDPAMVGMLSKAYAMIGMAGDVGELTKGNGNWFNRDSGAAKGAETKPTQSNDASSTDAKTTDGADKKDSKKANDYCKYIPTATEAIAGFQQMAAQSELNSIPTQSDTEQRAALEKAAKSHTERSKQSQMQAVGWYGGAACYATRMATGGIAVDWSSGLKLAAATFLGTFYQNEVDAHKEYASKVKNIANQLPGKGDCNPVTDRLCYCSEPSTENDPTYCLKEMHKKAIAQNSTRTSCVTTEMKADPQCKCEVSDTCFDKYILTESGVELGLSSGFSNTPFKGVRDLVRGELKGGNISNEAYAASMALAKKTLKDLASKLPDDGSSPPTGEKKTLYDELIKRGIPPLIASKMISANIAGADKYATKFQGGALASATPSSIKNTNQNKNNVLDFTGGNGLKLGSTDGQKEEKDEFDLSKFGAQQKKNDKSPQGKVLTFLEKASQKASISTKDQKIFDIISNRYQTSGRKRLEIQGD